MTWNLYSSESRMTDSWMARYERNYEICETVNYMTRSILNKFIVYKFNTLPSISINYFIKTKSDFFILRFNVAHSIWWQSVYNESFIKAFQCDNFLLLSFNKSIWHWKYGPGVVDDRPIHIGIRSNSALWFKACLVAFIKSLFLVKMFPKTFEITVE